MLTAVLNGCIGLSLSYGVGLFFLQLSGVDILRSIAASNLAAFVALLLTLKAEQMPWVKRVFLGRSLKTWPFLVMLYFWISLALSPILRDLWILLWMAFPLLLSTGFSLLIFGPVQDYFVARKQRKNRENSRQNYGTKKRLWNTIL
jgi:hypothetical protein